MLDRIFKSDTARQYRAPGRQRRGCGQHAHLGGVFGKAEQADVAAVRRATDLQVEGLVFFLEQQRVRPGLPEPMSPQPVAAFGIVGSQVKQGSAVGSPYRAGGLLDLQRQCLTADDVFGEQLKIARTGFIQGVEKPLSIGADGDSADRQELARAGQGIQVEQHLLRRAGVQFALRALGGSAGQQRVLRAADGAA